MIDESRLYSIPILCRKPLCDVVNFSNLSIILCADSDSYMIRVSSNAPFRTYFSVGCCIVWRQPMVETKKVIVGQKYNRLTVIERVENAHNGDTQFRCKCNCGKIIVVRGHHLISGNTSSCGCLRNENLIRRNTKHGDCYTRLYKTWACMIQRCTNTNISSYRNYGGRGITVCQEWLDNFENFKDWSLSNGYNDDLEIDRIENDKGYMPSNCRWVTKSRNCCNRRNSIRFSNGQSFSELLLNVGISKKDNRNLYSKYVYHFKKHNSIHPDLIQRFIDSNIILPEVGLC